MCLGVSWTGTKNQCCDWALENYEKIYFDFYQSSLYFDVTALPEFLIRADINEGGVK